MVSRSCMNVCPFSKYKQHARSVLFPIFLDRPSSILQRISDAAAKKSFQRLHYGLERHLRARDSERSRPSKNLPQQAGARPVGNHESKTVSIFTFGKKLWLNVYLNQPLRTKVSYTLILTSRVMSL